MRVPLPVVRGVLRWVVRPAFGPQVPIALQRRIADAMSRGTPAPRAVSATEVVLGGRPARRYAAVGASSDGAVLWVHGGAFITGSYATHGAFAAHLSAAVGAPVYLLDYRLAPEHPHPAAVDDIVAALALIPEEVVVLGGDSAGGCLALLAAPWASRRLAGLALVSPAVDLTLASCRAWTGDDPLIRTAWGEQGIAAMFGATPPDLLAADLTALPLMVVHVSEHERLRPEGEDLARRTGAELVVVPQAWHDIHLQSGLVRRADEATRQLGASIAAFLVKDRGTSA